MKKLFIYFYILLALNFASSLLSAQDIIITGVPSSLCANQSLIIGYEVSDFSPLSGNEFVAELSDNSGDFTDPDFIGSISSTNLLGNIPVQIPDGLTGTDYRIRVTSTLNSEGAPETGINNSNIAINCNALDYYWVGGTGNWSNFTHWAEEDGGTVFHTAPPTINDNVFFTPNSFTASNQIVNINQNALCNNITWTTNESQFPSLVTGHIDNTLTIAGSFILAQGVHRSIATIIFDSNMLENTINMADNLRSAFEKITFNGSSTWSLTSNFETQEVRFNGGNFNTNNFTVRADEWEFTFGSGSKIFNAGNSHIYASRFTQGANTTFNKGSSTLHIIASQEFSNSIDGDFDFNNVIIEADATITGNNQYASFIVNAGITVELNANDTQEMLDLQLNGTPENPIIITSTDSGVAAIFEVPSSGSVYANHVIFKDNYATGGATFTATYSSEISNVTGWTGLLLGQIITFPNLDDITMAQTATLGATASSGNAVSYSILSITGNATIENSTLTPTQTGLVGVTASQAGDEVTYGAAQSITRYIHLNIGDFPNELGQMKQATIVVGAADGISQGHSAASNISVNNALKAIISPNGELIVAGESRVLIWDELPTSYDVPADIVVGQPNFTSINPTPSQSILGPEVNDLITGDVIIGPNGELIVSDSRGILIWNTIPAINGELADVIIGQTNFTATAMAVTKSQFLSPLGVAVSNDGKLIVADFSAHRVLIFNSIPQENGVEADVVIGQPNFTTSIAGTSNKNLNFPTFVAVTPDNKLLIADALNNRVLVYDTIPTADYTAANAVIGQPDFNSNAIGTTGNSLNIPLGVSVSRTGKLAIADRNNNRVLLYNQIPTNNENADLVIGQPNFTSKGIDQTDITLRTVGDPTGVFWDHSENLLITDGGLNRIMIYGAKDIKAPTITNLTPLSPHYSVGAANQKSTITVEDQSGIRSAVAHWQEITALNPANPIYEQTDLTALGNGVYEFDIAVVETKSASPTGIEYYMEFTDHANNTLNTLNNIQRLPINYPNGIAITSFGVGTTTQAYRLMAIPLALSNATVEHVFSAILGGDYDPSKMRIFSYARESATEFTEATNATNLEVGKGYFALAASPASVTSPAGTTSFEQINVTGTDFQVFSVDLVEGWNLIGNPFMHDVVWADIELLSQVNPGDVDAPQLYGGNGYQTASAIPTGSGAFILNNTQNTISLKIPAKKNTGGRHTSTQENKNELSETSWEVLFKTIGVNGDMFTLGGIGMELEATIGKDLFDIVNPPAFASIKTINFNHPAFIASSFKKDIRETTHEEKWQFEYNVENTSKEKQKINWDNSYFGDNSPDLYLVDKTHFTTINMKEVNSYTFNHGNLTSFEVYFGDNVLEQLTPAKPITQSPFPNPFTNEITFNIGLPQGENYVVTLRIYDTVGKEIRTISSPLSSGYNSIIWNGLTNNGRETPTGMYAYRIHVKGTAAELVESGKIIKK